MEKDDKPKPDFSEVRSGGSSTAAAPGNAEPAAAVETYVVVAGDSLSKIAKRFYGDAKQWRKIHAANPEIKNPDLIHPGQRLKIPAPTEGGRS
jgi:nucleoid-associated protein YgaU